MSSKNSYAQAASFHSPPTLDRLPSQKDRVLEDIDSTVKAWLRSTTPTPPPRRSSEPIVVTVVRNGKTYTSVKTPDGELNARQRRKQRRAQEREAKEREEVEQVVRPPPEEEQSAIRTVKLDDLRPTVASSLSAFQFPSPSHSPSPDSRRPKALPPLNPFVRDQPNCANRSMMAPPLTPTHSSSEDGRPSTPRSTHSRNSSLNANAAIFNPTSYCSVPHHSPSNSHHSRGGSVVGSPAQDVASPELSARADSPLCERRHSIALAAWGKAQRRLSAQLQYPESTEIDAWQPYGLSRWDSQGISASPTGPLSARSWRDGDAGWPQSGTGLSSDFQSSQAFGSLNLESPTHSLSSQSGPRGMGRMRSASEASVTSHFSHRASPSTSSLPSSIGNQSAVFSTFNPSECYGDIGSSSAHVNAVSRVYSEVGMDPEADQLADLSRLLYDGNQPPTANIPSMPDLDPLDFERMEHAIVQPQPRPHRRSSRLTEGLLGEQSGKTKRRSPLTSSSELEQ